MNNTVVVVARVDPSLSCLCERDRGKGQGTHARASYGRRRRTRALRFGTLVGFSALIYRNCKSTLKVSAPFLARTNLARLVIDLKGNRVTMSSAVQFGSLPQDVPAATPEGVFLVHNRTCAPPVHPNSISNQEKIK